MQRFFMENLQAATYNVMLIDSLYFVFFDHIITVVDVIRWLTASLQ